MAGLGEVPIDRLRLEQLLHQVDGTLAPVNQLGFQAAAVKAPGWLKELVLALFEDVGKRIPDPDFFRSFTVLADTAKLNPQLTTCLDLTVLLSLARSALEMYLERGKGTCRFLFGNVTQSP